VGWAMANAWNLNRALDSGVRAMDSITRWTWTAPQGRHTAAPAETWMHASALPQDMPQDRPQARARSRSSRCRDMPEQ
jgi:hypothetical protein